MKRSTAALLLLCLPATTFIGLMPAPVAAAAASSTAPATQEAPSNTRYASRQVRLPAESFDPGYEVVETELTRAAAELAPRILGVDADTVSKWLKLNEVVKAGSMDVYVYIAIPPDAKHRVASEFLDAVLAAAQPAVQKLYAESRGKPVAQAEAERQRAAEEYDHAEHELRDKRAAVRADADRADVSPKGIADATAHLEEEKQKIELDLMGKKARREAMELQIAKQSQSIEEKVKADPIVTELQKAVDAREQKAQFVQKQMAAGVATQSESTEAIAVAADARAKLLQRRRDAAAEAGGEALEAFNRELLTLAVDVQEFQARLKFIDARLARLAKASDEVDSLQRAQNQAQAAEHELDETTKALRQLQKQVQEALPGELTVVSSENRRTPEGGGLEALQGGGNGGGGQTETPADATQPAQ